MTICPSKSLISLSRRVATFTVSPMAVSAAARPEPISPRIAGPTCSPIPMRKGSPRSCRLTFFQSALAHSSDRSSGARSVSAVSSQARAAALKRSGTQQGTTTLAPTTVADPGPRAAAPLFRYDVCRESRARTSSAAFEKAALSLATESSRMARTSASSDQLLRLPLDHGIGRSTYHDIRHTNPSPGPSIRLARDTPSASASAEPLVVWIRRMIPPISRTDH